MDKIKSVFGKVSSFVKKKPKEFLALGVFVVALSIYLITNAFAALTPTKSVIITSEKTSYEEKEPGSWQVEKSGKWISKGRARVTFDVDTMLMTKNKDADVILAIDTSNSMKGEKIETLKENTIDLIKTLLSNSNNRIALITFNTNSNIYFDFTNNTKFLVEQVSSFSGYGKTNYYQALVNVDNLLQDYTKKEDRELIVLFLTDGYPNEEAQNQVSQYKYLKKKYPYITINGIQYEMGDTILDPIKEISDNQFHADMETLNNVLFDASVAPIPYDEFKIVDYIDNRYFKLSSEEDITVSEGSVKLEEENGKQKITWTIPYLKSGRDAKLSMDIVLKDEYIGRGGIYPTNESEEIISSIREQAEDITSTKTPILSDKYNVIYDKNAPHGCTVANVPSITSHFVLDTVFISSKQPVCDGYQFKGWKLVTKNVTRVGDDSFIMPEEDVILRAKWSKIEVAKSMDGSISTLTSLYDVIAESAIMDNVSSEFVESDSGVNFNAISSDINGKGLYTRAGTEKDAYPIHYYRGDVDNNHVKFAGFCWEIVRTTETGGVKLIYDGKPNSNGYCNNTGASSQIGTSKFNANYTSPSDVGYMYGNRYPVSAKTDTSGVYIYGNDVVWNGSSYTLVNTFTSNNWTNDKATLASKYHYTCFSTGTTCSAVYYVYYYGLSTPIYFTLHNGINIDRAKELMSTNNTSSVIKDTIDNWYENNLTNYTNYLEDTIWCNDRSYGINGKDVNIGIKSASSSNFGTNLRLNQSINSGDVCPNLTCANINDSFTVGDTGNKKLEYPVGLLTADEAVLAGARLSAVNNDYYLSSGARYWLNSPSHVGSDSVAVFFIETTGAIRSLLPHNSFGVRPMISLSRKALLISGDGSSEMPYEVILYD